MYVSKAGVKDFGDRVRIDAYMYEEKNRKAMALQAKKEEGNAGAGGRRRAPGGRGPAPQ